MSIFEIFLKSNFFIQVIMLTLIVCSILSWGIIIYETCVLYLMKKEIKKFENKFGSGISLSKLYKDSTISLHTLRGMEKIFYFGFKEFSYLYHMDGYPIKQILEEIKRVMCISIYTELKKLEQYTIFLSIISFISPYVGLFGTVLSIIHIFFELGSMQYITLQTIAPGVSESLMFTAIGLFVAIPSGVSFNYFNLHINSIEQKYKILSEEFTSILQKQIFFKQIT